MKIVSGCLAGLRCRYDGRSREDRRIVELVRRGDAFPVCPEQLGGLPTPREEAAITSQDPPRVVTPSGRDVTAQFRRGAEETLRIARQLGAQQAILKERSPSCGCRWVWKYDADGRPRLEPGEGITARLLRENGLHVVSDEEYRADAAD